MKTSKELKAEWDKERRIRDKQLIVDSLGGQCVCCGYNRCIHALECHHINPEEKTVAIAQIRANHGGWPAMAAELRKCVLVCANCHREIEHDKVFLPENSTRFDENFANAGLCRKKPKKIFKPKTCLQCGLVYQPIYASTKFCSYVCAQANTPRKVLDRPTKEQLQDLVNTFSWVEIGRMYGVTDNGVRKWARLVGILPDIRVYDKRKQKERLLKRLEKLQ